jgi:hypothetical protein
MSLSNLSILLGLVVLGSGVFVFLDPARARDAFNRFPRATTPGWILMGASTLWFLYNFQTEDIADFAAIKGYMLIGFLVVGVGSMIYVKDFLSIRGLAVFIMLLAHYIVEVARWAPTPWRLVMIVWSYLMVLLGIFWTIQPYRLRDWIHWATASAGRFRVLAIARLAFGAILIVLGLTAYRGA